FGIAKSNFLKILNPIHNEGIRLAIGVFRSSGQAQNHWNSIPSTNKLKSVKKKTIKKWNTPNFNRRQDIAITRTIIGHSFLTHSYLINKEPQPICDTCHTALTIKHILEECTQYSPTRTDLKIPSNIAEALAENQTSKIIQFLNITNLIKKIIKNLTCIMYLNICNMYNVYNVTLNFKKQIVM
ncbi:Uncharacterized protein FWK35_00025896, partial [Aphis craccivora]